MKLCTCSLLFIKLIYMMSTASQGFSMWYISSVMVSVFASSAVDREFEPRLDQTKDYRISICCFSAKQEVLRRKSKYWLARNQNKVSERSDMSILGLLFQ
jgi:hypothetical protein